MARNIAIRVKKAALLIAGLFVLFGGGYYTANAINLSENFALNIDPYSKKQIGDKVWNDIKAFFLAAEEGIETENLKGLMALYSENYKNGDHVKGSAGQIWSRIFSRFNNMATIHNMRFITTSPKSTVMIIRCSGILVGVPEGENNLITIDNWTDSDHILTKENGLPNGTILNADGSHGEMCLNGLRCLAQHLIDEHAFPEEFKITMNNKVITCTKVEKSIRCELETATYVKSTKVEDFDGHVVQAPNPHFVIFENTTINDLKKHGPALENNPAFPSKTNVEFVWKENDYYNVLVHERGSGMTLGCGTGASAVLSTLLHLEKINAEEKVIIKMPGGKITCWVNNIGKTILQAPAYRAFKGSI